MRQTYKTYIGARTWRNKMISQAARRQLNTLQATEETVKPDLNSRTLSGGYFTNTTAFLDLIKHFRGGLGRLRLTK